MKRCAHPSLFFLGVNPNLFTNPSIILLLLPGVNGIADGTGGTSFTSLQSVSSLFLDLTLLLLLLEVARDRIDSLDFLALKKAASSLSFALPSEELHLDSGRSTAVRRVVALSLRFRIVSVRDRSISAALEEGVAGIMEERRRWWVVFTGLGRFEEGLGEPLVGEGVTLAGSCDGEGDEERVGEGIGGPRRPDVNYASLAGGHVPAL